jgi:hypothetical protein
MFTGTPKGIRPDLPDEWDLFLRRALAPSSADRFRDAARMLAALEMLRTGED